MNIDEFFEAVSSGRVVSELEMFNFVQNVTDNFDEMKEQLLLMEYEAYLNKNVSKGSYKRLNEWTPKRPDQIKFQTLGFIIVNGKKLTGQKSKDISTIKNSMPIHWLNGESSLRQLLSLLQSAGLIDGRQHDEIIKEHFFVDGKMPTKEPQPIMWLVESKYLAYLMHRLGEEFIINIRGKKHQLTASHFISKEKSILNTNSLASQLSQLIKHSRSTDKRISSIENIIQQVKS